MSRPIEGPPCQDIFVAASVELLWSSHTPACGGATVSPLLLPTRCTPSLWVVAVRECPDPGISLSHGALAVPGVTWFVATTFSPGPLAQEWKHRILRSPHDVGQVGTCTDAPL